MKRAVLLGLLFATPALAQDSTLETVTIHGNSLVGVWHGTLGQSVFSRGFVGKLGMMPAKFGQMTLIYCRIARVSSELAMSCPQFGNLGRVTIVDGLVRIGSGRVAFEGEQPDVDTLRGRFRSRFWTGLTWTSPGIAEAFRVVPRADKPDTTGRGPLLRQILEQGLTAVPQDAEAMKKNRSQFILPKLGQVQSLAYLGQETKWDWPPPPGTRQDIMNLPSRPDFYSVYSVRFTDGELLCGLHQREDGVLDAIGCV